MEYSNFRSQNGIVMLSKWLIMMSFVGLCEKYAIDHIERYKPNNNYYKNIWKKKEIEKKEQSETGWF